MSALLTRSGAGLRGTRGLFGLKIESWYFVMTICSLSVLRGFFRDTRTMPSSSLSRLILTLMLSVADRVIGGAGVSSEVVVVDCDNEAVQ